MWYKCFKTHHLSFWLIIAIAIVAANLSASHGAVPTADHVGQNR
jgi:hypothetical protein